MDDFDYDYDYEEEFPINSFVEAEHSVQTVYEHCIIPSVASIIPNICDLIMYNLLFNVITQSAYISKSLFHLISSTMGILLILSINCPIRMYIFIAYLLSGYSVLWTSFKISKKLSFSPATFTIVVLVFSLLMCEFYFPFPSLWLQIRGVIMILAMKVISLSHDCEKAQKFPTFFEYVGYACCPANCLFGPWIPFSEYCAIIEKPHRRNKYWIIRIVICLGAALLFLTISNCWCSYFIPDNNRLLNSYRMALTFRTSHYFVSYLSEMSMLIAGYNQEKHQYGKWGYRITNPFAIELPSSLVSVVVNWNVPMHMFLKKYVYRRLLPYGQFKAIFATYFLSSLLHGFNIEIAMVLLTIGVFSYVQLKFRDKLSEDIDACIQIRPCKYQCNHKYKRGDISVTLLIILFSLLTILHLAYLGMLMDAIDNPESPSIYAKWDDLKFCSHIIIFFCYVYCRL